MCWSAEASLAFAGLGYAMALLCYLTRCRPRHSNVDWVGWWFYGLMETLQWIQLAYGDLDDCTPWNTLLTLIGHVLLWGQPVLWNFISIRISTTPESRHLFRFTTLASVLAFTVSSIALAIGMNSGMPSSDEVLNNVGRQTCSFASEATASRWAHYHWIFAYHSLSGYRPHGFAWLTLTTLPQLFRQSGRHWLGPGWLTFAVQLGGNLLGAYLFGWGHAWWTGWCAVSVPSAIVFIIYNTWEIFDCFQWLLAGRPKLD
eukprot:TRINITY_DN8992_c0_g1_i1.p1 TRINITY_DN8992_c0_g1~~TRINITY_DN8992_c0_g1_i1.p1  ORF type:complete len:276 (-),score=51.99 TRINITY_DN8992_c0_g1_i1:81-854(-)